MTRLAFTALVVLVALQRLVELRRSAQNEAKLRERGGREHAPGQMPWMRLLHLGWLVAMPLEVWLLARPWVTELAAPALALFLVGQALRVLAMRTLRTRWTVKIMTLPEAPPVTAGVFRYVRHPNYLGVVLELAALPLVHGAYLTALVFSVANAVLLAFRIRAEERALREVNDYDAWMRRRPRFLPGRLES